MRILQRLGLLTVSTLAAIGVALATVVSVFIPAFAGIEPRPLNRTPRSIFDTRRMGLC